MLSGDSLISIMSHSLFDLQQMRTGKIESDRVIRIVNILLLLLNRNNNLYMVYRDIVQKHGIYLTRIVYLVDLVVYFVELGEDVRMNYEFDALDSPRRKKKRN